MKAEQLRKSILQLAIQGKLVPQDPADEPASVLLERIRAEKQRLIKEGKIKKDKGDSVTKRRHGVVMVKPVRIALIAYFHPDVLGFHAFRLFERMIEFSVPGCSSVALSASAAVFSAAASF